MNMMAMGVLMRHRIYYPETPICPKTKQRLLLKTSLNGQRRAVGFLLQLQTAE